MPSKFFHCNVKQIQRKFPTVYCLSKFFLQFFPALISREIFIYRYITNPPKSCSLKYRLISMMISKICSRGRKEKKSPENTKFEDILSIEGIIFVVSEFLDENDLVNYMTVRIPDSKSLSSSQGSVSLALCVQ